jgi:hypothetical protein
MSLFDSASLVVTPNGVKDGKLYSIKPTDGSGDLSVTRATTATRVNSAGLVELVPRNLIQQSSAFNVSPWVNANVTLTSGITDVNGGNKAFRFQCSATNSYVYNVISSTIGVQYTHSVYVRSISGTKNIQLTDAYQGGGVSTTVTTEWQRITLTLTATGNNIGIQVWNESGAYATDIYICFAQTEQGATATDYYPTTTRLNIPRLDYTNGSCPSILVEPQRTNLLTRSEEFNDSSWAVNATITANTAISPDGTQDADTILGTGFIGKNILQSGIHTFSVFAKAGTSNEIRLNVFDGTTDRGVYYNLSNGTITSSYGTIIASNIVSYGNGWYRIIITTNNATRSYVQIHRDSAQTCFIYGAQLESGAYPTSYIPTTSASVTRNADVISKTGISSLIGQTEGTALLDFEFNGEDESIIMDIAANGLSPQNRIILYQPNTTIVQFIVLDNSIAQVNIASSSYSVGQRLKVAIAYKLNDFAFYINGVQIGTSGSGTVPLTNRIDIGNRQDGGYPSPISVNNAILFKTRLTNDQLAQLTTI